MGIMKTKGLNIPQENLKNKFDNPLEALKEKIDVKKLSSTTADKTIIPSIIETKMSNEKRFVMDTEF